MTHQVLARKWRPRDFESLVGQEHVVRALTHALDSGRLHHAYLFTGTRGVGKTTIARILAKSLNCETGTSARPCGRCRACTEIDEGRFPDYLELDAASNRGVDEMVQLLENAVYSPAAGRYKVYVIDEVHMLTTHAFNAMLKTLEEPPAHVVFILATTDPQKVPVTVLSRCLQFSLKNMPPAAIAGHLGRVLESEGIPAEPLALPLIGRAAAGSMRDALSLLDQAIAFSAGRVTEAAVREMLGVVDRRHLERLLDALLAGDGPALVAVADEMLAGNAPFGRTLADLAALLQRIALAQVGAIGDEDDPALLQRFADAVAAEDLQVWYQIVIHGGRDLPLAPDEHTGFTMTLLRLLAFRPDAPGGARGQEPARRISPTSASRPAAQPAQSAQSAQALRRGPSASLSSVRARPDEGSRSAEPAAGAAIPARPPEPPPAPAPTAPRAAAPEPSPPARPTQERPVRRAEPVREVSVPPWEDDPPPFPPWEDGSSPGEEDRSEFGSLADTSDAARTRSGESDPAARTPPVESARDGSAAPVPADRASRRSDAIDPPAAPGAFDGDWPALASRLEVSGLPRQFMEQSELVEADQLVFRVRVPIRPLADATVVGKVRDLLSTHFGAPVRLTAEVGSVDRTAAADASRKRSERLEEARVALEADPFVQALIADFGGRIVPGSIQPAQ